MSYQPTKALTAGGWWPMTGVGAGDAIASQNGKFQACSWARSWRGHGMLMTRSWRLLNCNHTHIALLKYFPNVLIQNYAKYVFIMINMKYNVCYPSPCTLETTYQVRELAPMKIRIFSGTLFWTADLTCPPPGFRTFKKSKPFVLKKFEKCIA